jgi:hypothetical protein
MTATIGVLCMLIVFPDAAFFVMRLPIWLQTVISQIPEGTPVILVILPGASAIAAGLHLVNRGRRHLVVAYRAGQFSASENTLLYLRPFVADKSPFPYTTPLDNWVLFGFLCDLRAWTARWLTLRGVIRYEEFIEYAFRRFGTLVTIGDPTERLPQLGAKRVYIESSGSTGRKAEDAWKTEVAEQIARAKLILLHVGFSEAIRWEIKTVIEVADPLRIVLCVYPPGKRKLGFRNLDSARRAEVNILWTEFRETCGAIFPRGLPEAIGDARFVKFDASWTAQPVQATTRIAWFLPARTPRPRRDTIDGALVWLSWLMVPERFPRRLARRFINVATFFLAIVAFMFVVAGVIDLFSRS